MEKFSSWLKDELKARNMKQADLARASHLDTAVISNLINDKRGPGDETCTAIANAFGLPVEHVYRAAGLLPDLPTPRDQYEEIIRYRLSVLDDSQLENVLRYIEFISSESQKPVRTRSE